MASGLVVRPPQESVIVRVGLLRLIQWVNIFSRTLGLVDLFTSYHYGGQRDHVYTQYPTCSHFIVGSHRDRLVWNANNGHVQRPLCFYDTRYRLTLTSVQYQRIGTMRLHGRDLYLFGDPEHANLFNNNFNVVRVHLRVVEEGLLIPGSFQVGRVTHNVGTRHRAAYFIIANGRGRHVLQVLLLRFGHLTSHLIGNGGVIRYHHNVVYVAYRVSGAALGRGRRTVKVIGGLGALLHCLYGH